jgi:predicted enzyme related to lactoylglutathione lyase
LFKAIFFGLTGRIIYLLQNSNRKGRKFFQLILAIFFRKVLNVFYRRGGEFMLNFNSILVFSENPAELAAFYEKVFEKGPDWDMEGYRGFQLGAAAITIGPHDKVKGKSQNPERIMFNLETEDVKEEFERIKAIGGVEVIAEPYGDEEEKYEGLVATFADPDGNYFQLMTPMTPQ